MSITTWIAAVWLRIKLLFGRLEPEIKDAVHTGVVITERLKDLVESPAAGIITALIPGTADDVCVVALRAALPTILAALKLTDKELSAEDPETAVNIAMAELATLDKNVKSAFLHNISVLLAQVAADGKLTWSDGVLILEWFYKRNFKAA